MTHKPKTYLGLIIVLAIIAIFTVFAYSQTTKSKSKATLAAEGNQFKLSFSIDPKDQNALSAILSDLALPASISKGTTIELDSSSQAKLAQIIPITADLKFSKKEVSFVGNIPHGFLLASAPVTKLKLPQTTNIAIAAPKLDNLLTQKLNFPQKLTDFIKNSQQEGTLQYFYTFNENQYVFIFKSKSAPEDLKQLESDDFTYKEDTQPDYKFILLTFPTQAGEETTLFVLKKDDFVLLSPSVDSLRFVEDLAKSKEKLIDFPKNSKQNLAYAIYLKNNGKLKDQIVSYLVDAKDQTINFTNNISSLYLVLSPEQISGLIGVK